MSTARYTRLVALSKALLWGAVAVMIALLFWIASDNTGDNGNRLVFSSVRQNEDLQTVMIKPHFQGVDAQNRPYTVIAEEATQIDAQTVSMKAIRADMATDNGTWLALNALSGVMQMQKKQIELTGGVDMFYEGGYEFRTDHAHIDVAQGSVTGDAPIEGQGPPGTLKADSFSVLDRGRVIRFNGSVRMKLYR